MRCLKYEINKSPVCAIKENRIAKKKNFTSKKILLKKFPAKNIENNENTKEPKAPDKVFLGLIFVNFFHLKVFPKTYPPISESTQRIMTHKRILNE